MVKKNNEHLKNVSKTLLETISGILNNRFNIIYTADPALIEKDIIEYNSLLRVFGLEKFNLPCVVSSISFYTSQKKLSEHSPLGTIILYLAEVHAERFIKTVGLEYKGDDENIIQTSFGEFCKMVCEEFKDKLRSLGYKDLILSAPINERNNIVPGVEFNYDQQKLNEITFHFWKEKVLVAEITMAPAG